MIPGIIAQASAGESNEVELEGVELLLGFSGTNGQQQFLDEGRRSRAVSFSGNAQITTAQSKFGGTSAFFDGSGDGLFIPPGPGMLFADQPFTVEGWFRFATLGGVQTLMAQRYLDDPDTMAWSLAKRADHRVELWVCKDEINRPQCLSINPLVINTWYHIAFDKDEDNTLRLYVDGVMQSFVEDVTQVRDFRRPITIGIKANATVGFNGYADEIRVVKGSAIWGNDAGFVVPAGPYARPTQDLVPPVDASFANVLLLLGFDGREGSFDQLDDSSYHRLPTMKVGTGVNSKVRGALGGRRKRAYYSPASSGSGPATVGATLLYPDDAVWTLGTEQFTIEAWVRQSAFATNQMIAGQRVSASTSTGQAWNFVLLSTGQLEWQMVDTGGTFFTLQSPALTNQKGRTVYDFEHVAVTRDGTGKVRLYVNGEMVASGTPVSLPFSVRDVTTAMSLFGSGNFSDLQFIGDADEVRITKGVARYVTDTTFDLPETVFWRNEAGPPAFSVDPSITSRNGFFAVGDILDLNIGTHNGYDPDVQWRRDGAAIPGATGRAYALFPADAGAVIDATVLVWNYQGETTATAPTVGPVAAARVYDTGGLAPGGDMQSGADRLIPAGDAQAGTDVLLWKERTT